MASGKTGGSAEYADYRDIESKLIDLFERYRKADWGNEDQGKLASDFLLELWSIHPFREGNTRTCVTFLWHYLKARKIEFRVELLRNSPMYVRDSLVMANYDQKNYLQRIISDAFVHSFNGEGCKEYEEGAKEQYQIAKSDYEIFREKYSIKK